MHFYIKNMVCNRCILVVEQELKKLGVEHGKVSLGEIETMGELSKEQQDKLSTNLSALGFEILDDAKSKLIEKIKNIIIKQIHYSSEDVTQRYSDLLSKALHKDYSYLSALFSDVEGTTIEKFIINQKIEKVKELIIYNELSLTEISYQMGYSSVAHLSNQFKKVTGLTPSHFKKLGEKRRKSLDEI